jgi:metal-responsive CopG/Arc/MetJ family transcriptional regulator
VRLQPNLLISLDEWIEKQREHRSRPEAIRELLERALVKNAPARSSAKAREASAAKAEKHAHDHIDEALQGETQGVRSERKKRLTSLPSGFKRR